MNRTNRIEKLRQQYEIKRSAEIDCRTRERIAIENYRISRDEERLIRQRYIDAKKRRSETKSTLLSIRNRLIVLHTEVSVATTKYRSFLQTHEMKMQMKADTPKVRKNTKGIDLVYMRQCLPIDVLNYISSYLPYSVYIQLLETDHKPLTLLNSFTSEHLRRIFTRFSNSVQITILLLAKMNEADCILYRLLKTKPEIITKIKWAIHFMKQFDPKYAYLFLKNMAILKKICGNRRNIRVIGSYNI